MVYISWYVIYFAEKSHRSIEEQWRSHEKHSNEKTKTRERLQPIGASAEHSQGDETTSKFYV